MLAGNAEALLLFRPASLVSTVKWRGNGHCRWSCKPWDEASYRRSIRSTVEPPTRGFSIFSSDLLLCLCVCRMGLGSNAYLSIGSYARAPSFRQIPEHSAHSYTRIPQACWPGRLGEDFVIELSSALLTLDRLFGNNEQTLVAALTLAEGWLGEEGVRLVQVDCLAPFCIGVCEASLACSLQIECRIESRLPHRGFTFRSGLHDWRASRRVGGAHGAFCTFCALRIPCTTAALGRHRGARSWTGNRHRRRHGPASS